MALYKVIADKLTLIKSKPFSFEKEIHTLTENNLDTLFNLEFVCSEFSLKNFRIDTLAFDKEANAFVIIEYKKDKNFSIIDQGFAYLSLMLNNKAEFILEYNENSKTTIKKKDVEWSQTKVIFISPSFTSFQKESLNFKDLPIELWEIKRYSDDMVLYNRIAAERAGESIKTVSGGGKKISSVIKEIKVYSEDNLLEGISENIKDAYFKIKEEICQIDSGIYDKITKTMICFYSDGKGMVWIEPHKNNIRVYLRKGEYSDKYGKIKQGGWGGYPALTLFEGDIDLNYLQDLFYQAFSS